MTCWTAPSGAGVVRWFERRGRGFGLHITPLDISEIFTHYRAGAGCRLGVHFRYPGRERRIYPLYARDGPGSRPPPCNWTRPSTTPNNAIIVAAGTTAGAARPGLYRGIARGGVARPATPAGGRAFLLFTSHRALQASARVAAQQVDYPLFVQGASAAQRAAGAFRGLPVTACCWARPVSGKGWT